eukprot:TRINITY_DN25949_c0_g1_i1.p1 TRINITY_DN25949_c0_g1~~TRINITY_DN25949_c0_g1_i1.p1  ORF type:complete len:365 (-),score=65.77 TRINITY_DN25949_c0_g1_i1:79-1173(-)
MGTQASSTKPSGQTGVVAKDSSKATSDRPKTTVIAPEFAYPIICEFLFISEIAQFSLIHPSVNHRMSLDSSFWKSVLRTHFPASSIWWNQQAMSVLLNDSTEQKEITSMQEVADSLDFTHGGQWCKEKHIVSVLYARVLLWYTCEGNLLDHAPKKYSGANRRARRMPERLTEAGFFQEHGGRTCAVMQADCWIDFPAVDISLRSFSMTCMVYFPKAWNHIGGTAFGNWDVRKWQFLTRFLPREMQLCLRRNYDSNGSDPKQDLLGISGSMSSLAPRDQWMRACFMYNKDTQEASLWLNDEKIGSGIVQDSYRGEIVRHHHPGARYCFGLKADDGRPSMHACVRDIVIFDGAIWNQKDVWAHRTL